MMHKMILTVFVATFLLSSSSAAAVDKQNVEAPEDVPVTAPAPAVLFEEKNNDVPSNPEGGAAPAERSDSDLDTANTWWGGYYRRPYWGWGGYGSGWRRGWGYGGYGGWGARNYENYYPWVLGRWGK